MRTTRPRPSLVSLAFAIAVAVPWIFGCSSGPDDDDDTPASASGATAPATKSAPSPTPSPSNGRATIAGIAFVDSSITGQGSRAELPAGVKIHPIGSKITGTEGCPTTRYRTDGLIVAVIDYAGRPTSGALAVVENRDDGGRLSRAPYYFDLDPGRKLQFLGPVFENGTYELELTYGFRENDKQTVAGTFQLARRCPTLE